MVTLIAVSRLWINNRRLYGYRYNAVAEIRITNRTDGYIPVKSQNIEQNAAYFEAKSNSHLGQTLTAR